MLPIIERRRIEAEILKHVYDVLTESHGAEAARETVGAAVSRSAIAQGAKFRAELGRDPDFADFAAILPNWTANDALTIEVKSATAETLEFDVVRCRYAEMYREMGLGEIGHLLSCNRDGEFCTGYNPNMELTRTGTLMQGAKRCDFRYRMKPAG
ncbi:L-2-amino-thiazoline-4-carboxylic acid hydrolase [Prosthecomicrobium hirschii]|uniref:L-2-amino-thiazoline-4-carboxylic acid hydrolase n=1 Tax=Prosthecodimorpha hirschii TaxID=665126 RepID=UPI0015E3EADE|nr:L-2-amino-thiazoline-4-carboxylic acid hydrolase [Prosthecomicrobium hirschii]MCW1842674.1 L-2-amino-thiazoline-4-carboxylic acid hydrolase [Prosthecomicrobium hirschii]